MTFKSTTNKVLIVEVSQQIVTDVGEQYKTFLTEKVMLSSDLKDQKTFVAAKLLNFYTTTTIKKWILNSLGKATNVVRYSNYGKSCYL